MAKEAQTSDNDVTSKTKKKSTILIIALIVLGLVLAAGVAHFVTKKIVTSSTNAPVKHDPGVFIKLGDPKDGTMIVNVGDAKAGRFLKVGVVLEMNPTDKNNFKDSKLTDSAQAKVLDAVTGTFRKQSIDQFDASNEEKLKDSIKENVNASLGDGSVYNVYITSFMLQ